ncbi:MAG: hypothetical protein ACM3SX_23290, partial [Deltaproteobacteria bacterium]
MHVEQARDLARRKSTVLGIWRQTELTAPGPHGRNGAPKSPGGRSRRHAPKKFGEMIIFGGRPASLVPRRQARY